MKCRLQLDLDAKVEQNTGVLRWVIFRAELLLTWHDVLEYIIIIIYEAKGELK